jgi:phospholipid/cholesterol/gamma-HCH transport system substrate-binding protein
LGPTTAQLHQITAALAARQLAIERLVHNLAVVTRAAGQDRQLSSLIQAGNTTLQTLADQDAPLRQSLSELPSTLATAETTLRNARPLAKELSPTLLSLTPAANALPSVFASLGPYATLASSIIRRQIRPFVTSTLPLARNLSPAVRQLAGMTPDLEKSFRVLNYWLNETAYNPGGDNPGYLFWLPWGVHNLNSVFSVQDAHGGVGQGIALVACKSASAGGQALGATLATVLNTSGLCNNK